MMRRSGVVTRSCQRCNNGSLPCSKNHLIAVA